MAVGLEKSGRHVGASFALVGEKISGHNKGTL